MRLKFARYWLIGVMLLLAVTTSAQTSTPPPSAAPTTEQYTVRRGDNLSMIGRAFGVSAGSISAANNLAPSQPLQIGQVLTVPLAPDDPTLTLATQLYTVSRGDSLSSIARQFNTTPQTLTILNRLTNPGELTIGIQLKVPVVDDSLPPTPQPTTTTVPDETVTPAPPEATTEATPIVPVQRGVEIFLRNQRPADLLDTLSQLDVTWVKLVVNWRETEPIQGQPDLTDLDAVIAGLNAQGKNIMLTLTGAPDWARPSATDFVLTLSQYGPPDDPATFAAFASAIATRYAGVVGAYEIWLEPNLRRSWIDATTSSRETARLSSVQYIDLLRAASAAIRAADRNAIVVSAGLAPTGLTSAQNSIADRLFLRTLLSQGLLDLVDAIGAEPDGFANPPDATCCAASEGVLTHYEQPEFYFLDTLSTYRELITNAGGHNTPIWVTRFGWGSAEVNTLVSPNLAENPYLTYTDANEQTEYSTRAFVLASELGFVETMFLYNLNGCTAGLPEACFYSVLSQDGTLRPLARALNQE